MAGVSIIGPVFLALGVLLYKDARRRSHARKMSATSGGRSWQALAVGAETFYGVLFALVGVLLTLALVFWIAEGALDGFGIGSVPWPLWSSA